MRTNGDRAIAADALSRTIPPTPRQGHRLFNPAPPEAGLFWDGKIRHGKPGRPGVPKEVRALIRTMSRENPLWGAPRIHGELLKLGIDIGETSVSKYLVRRHNPPSQTWRTFLENHAKSMVSVDFFTVPTIRFEVLYVLLAHERRRILHFGVT